MQVDSYFTIGSSHSVCEDYALSCIVAGRPFGVLSDGCSSSSFTDFGSRFLCLAAREALILSSENDFHQDGVLPHACSMVGKMLPWECLDATTIALYCSPYYLDARAAGDGVIVGRKRDGSFHVRAIEFSNNAPGYLTYLLDSVRYEAFCAGTPSSPGAIRTVTESLWAPDFSEQLCEPAVIMTKVEPLAQSFWYYASYNRQDYDLIAAFSDGVQSFQQQTSNGSLEEVSLPTVLKQLMLFKNMRGQFVTRRCSKFFKKFCAKNKWSHYDDFSFVAMFDDEVQEEV